MVGGLLGFASFVAIERRAAHPLLDVSLFRRRVFSVMAAAGGLATAAATVVIFYAMLWLQDIRGYSATEAGLLFLSFSVGFALAGVASGRLERVAPWIVMSAALAMSGVGSVGMGVFDAIGPFLAVAVLAGFGTGLGHDYAGVISQAVVPPGQAGSAAGAVLTAVVTGGGVGLAIAVSAFDAATMGGTGESTAIDAVLIVVGVVCLVGAAIVVGAGRHPELR